MIICEQCGNEFAWGKTLIVDHTKMIGCPYCKFANKIKSKKGKNYEHNEHNSNKGAGRKI